MPTNKVPASALPPFGRPLRQGDDVCALEKELSLGVRVPSAAGGVTPNDIIGNIAEEPPASASARNRRQATNERDKGERWHGYMCFAVRKLFIRPLG